MWPGTSVVLVNRKQKGRRIVVVQAQSELHIVRPKWRGQRDDPVVKRVATQ